MYRFLIICIAALLAGILPALAEPVQTPRTHLSLNDLEKRLMEIEVHFRNAVPLDEVVLVSASEAASPRHTPFR